MKVGRYDVRECKHCDHPIYSIGVHGEALCWLHVALNATECPSTTKAEPK